ncbi:MAG: Threonylcarbamoyl-AMP synthase [Bacteroidetes bacterium ADurb.Bin090]|nr:MAG: Threonylcarbamoyl-AMP synthase [Bacteroidetes bacterium ADurb.Bin090]
MSLQEEINKAREVLTQGGVILYPTDTVWGLGCDATNPRAVEKIYTIKKRAENKAMIVLLENPGKLDLYVKELPGLAWDLIELSDKRLTIVYQGARNLAANLIADDGSVAIRVTGEPFSQGLCRSFRKAIVSTSANISGMPAPGSFREISGEIVSAVDYVVDYRRNEPAGKARPSSIVSLGSGGEIKIIRP